MPRFPRCHHALLAVVLTAALLGQVTAAHAQFGIPVPPNPFQPPSPSPPIQPTFPSPTKPTVGFGGFASRLPVPKPLSAQLGEAIEAGDLAKIKTLLQSDPTLVNTPNVSYDYTLPLNRALRLRAMARPMITLLLAAGADVNATTRYPSRPLQTAIYAGLDLDLIETLIARGADVNAPDNTYSGVPGDTPLDVAVKRLDVPLVKLLLSCGAKVTRPDGSVTLLQEAIRPNENSLLNANSLPIVQLLLDAGADVNQSNPNGLKPIHLAMHFSDLTRRGFNYGRVVPVFQGATLERMLVEKGADVNAADCYGMKPLLYALLNRDKPDYELLIAHGAIVDPLTQAFQATAMNDVPGLKRALAANTALTELRAPSGESLLHVAAIWGAVESAQFLLQNGADVDVRDPSARTPLYDAVAFSSGMPMLRLLLDNGADPNQDADSIGGGVEAYLNPEVYRNGGYYANMNAPLSLAVGRNSVEMVKLLLDKGAFVTHPMDKAGPLKVLGTSSRDPLAQEDTVQIAKLLMAKGADLKTALINYPSPTSWQDNILGRAIYDDNLPLMHLLLEKGRQNIDFKSESVSARLLPLAARAGEKDMVSLLISQGVDVNAKPPGVTETALAWAVDPGTRESWESAPDYKFDAARLDAIKLLLAKGANVNAKDSNNSRLDATVLMHAASTGQASIVRLLLENGADIHAKDSAGQNALIYAITPGLKTTGPDVVRLLLEKGVDLDPQNSQGALFKAASFNLTDVVKLLLAKGVDINAKNVVGETVLISVIKAFGSTDLIQLLIKSGADVNAQANDGKTALSWAQAREDEALITLLQAAGAKK